MKVVYQISYKLVKGASAEEFLLASKKCHDDSMAKNKGFISWDVLRDGDTWVDVATFESIEDAKNAESGGNETTKHPSALAFYAFIDFTTLKSKVYTLEKSHTATH